MKRRLLCVFLALLFLLTGCVIDPAPAQSETQETEYLRATAPAEEEEKPFGLAFVMEYGFNPYECVCLTNRPVISLCYEGLFVLGTNYQPEPVLCDRFAGSEDGKTYLFTLRQGARFSNGAAITAQDVVASLSAARDSAYYGGRFSKVSAFRAVDDKTVEITLTVPYENLPLLLDVPVVQADTVADKIPLGSGPYRVDSAEERMLLRRSARWWQDTDPPIDFETIPLTAAKTPRQIRDSFEFGATTLVCADLNAPTAVGYRCDYELWDNRTTIMQYLGFNLNRGLFANRELRAAMTHIIDREQIIASAYSGFAEPAYLPCAPASALYDKELAKNYGYDKEAFLAAIRSAGVTGDSKCVFLVWAADATRLDAAHRIADALEECGMSVEIRAQDREAYQKSLRNGDYDLYFGEARLSGSFDLSEFFRSGGSLCFGGLQSSSMYELSIAALENSGNCYELYQNVMDLGLFCPLLFKAYAVMANRGAIDSLQPAIDSVFHLPGGRTLADASASYEQLAGTVEEPTEPTEQ